MYNLSIRNITLEVHWELYRQLQRDGYNNEVQQTKESLAIAERQHLRFTPSSPRFDFRCFQEIFLVNLILDGITRFIDRTLLIYWSVQSKISIDNPSITSQWLASTEKNIVPKCFPCIRQTLIAIVSKKQLIRTKIISISFWQQKLQTTLFLISELEIIILARLDKIWLEILSRLKQLEAAIKPIERLK